MASKTQERSVWSDLQPILLELVLQRLVLRDYLKCRQVCRSWRSIVNDAIKNKCPPPLPQFPSLLLFQYDPAKLLDITGNKLQLLMPIRALEGYSPDRVYSIEGWLMIRKRIPKPRNNDDVAAHSLFWIINPVSGEKFKLPRLPCIDISGSSWDKCAFSSAPDSQNFLVVILTRFLDDSILQLRFCKVNDKSWTRIETNESFSKDIVLLGWKLYSVNQNSVTIFNLKDPNAITTERLDVQFPNPNNNGLFETNETCRRLVSDSTCGEVLLVFFTRQCKINIFKLDMSGTRWIEVDNLNGRALFADYAGVQVISNANLNSGPTEFTRGNCVFFTFYEQSIEVFSLKEKKYWKLDVDLSEISNPILWFTPSPW